MSESAGDRFRRIIKAWQEQQQDTPALPAAPPESRPAAEPAKPEPASLSTPPPQPTQTPAPAAEAPPPTDAEGSVQTAQQSAQAAQQPERTAQRSERTAQRSERTAQRSERTAQRSERTVKWPGRPKQEEADLPPIELPPLEPGPDLEQLRTPADARNFLEKLRAKTAQVVQDFANGVINQRQFQAVYSHYQRQRLEIEEALIEMPGSGAWRAAAVEGHTTFLRQQHAAQVLGYAIYETESGMPVTQVGDFDIDAALLVPMLSSFRSITQELFGAGMKRTEIEGGRHLCFVPGRYTTLIVIYSAEPAAVQLETIEDLHRDFELVNDPALASGDVSQRALAFTHLWAFEQEPGEI